jgi:urease accessory protein
MSSLPAGTTLTTFATLADGRFPSGGHAHSLGFEAAAATFPLTTGAALVEFGTGRLSTVGVTDACIIAAIGHRLAHDDLDWEEADCEVDARIVGKPLRTTSRSLGRQWIRAGRRLWPGPVIEQAAATTGGPHQVPAFVAVATAAGLDLRAAIAIHLHHIVASVTTAAVRLHGLDPFDAQRCQIELGARAGRITDDALELATADWEHLPAPASPLTDVLAEAHARWDSRLFQS